MKTILVIIISTMLTACQPEPNVALRIDCGEFNNQGVAITLNGKPIGDCPLDIMTQAGQNDISVNKTFADGGFIDDKQHLQLADNINKRVKFDLQVVGGIDDHFQRYHINPNGYVLDEQTNLIWMRCILGQEWDGKRCIGDGREFTAHQAAQIVGNDNWRLPTVDELDSIVFCSKGRKPSQRHNGKYVEGTNGECLGSNYQEPTMNPKVFFSGPDTFQLYWSSTPLAHNIPSLWSVSFESGRVYNFNNTNYQAYVRLVRDYKR
ncbi:DUF1566 domain-containing protein [Vibrio cholerae]|uniref:Lcl C-terminal domain-containing protein n=1 Tax=Vibrio cholerae TaxID=666 RepID=UPI001DDAE780|nr:DUF1566 domain-containing protein [Vibrio cholerae]EJL6549176.1 DUF1566 domain-containing protein [Vibrio cholerae]EKF9573049.1 DUF1566 domain-containing protein [Vibrio cholerae]ELB8601948.1 DUF1566 domain-containing protein [Vibrio cholerae]GIA08041.1 putative Fimh-like protein [Vibrio cholerae]